MKNNDNSVVPRRCAASEIKLLRLELYAHANSTCEDIGREWNHAQPAENLSPFKAAESLGIELWSPASVVKNRYKVLQRRYPPEQFAFKHLDWRPSFELLSVPRKRLNWYWQSGFVPLAESDAEFKGESIWDKHSVEPSLDSAEVLRRLCYNQ
jgi:hypothetical protein